MKLLKVEHFYLVEERLRLYVVAMSKRQQVCLAGGPTDSFTVVL